MSGSPMLPAETALPLDAVISRGLSAARQEDWSAPLAPSPRMAAYGADTGQITHRDLRLQAATASSDRLDDPFFDANPYEADADDEIPIRVPRKRGGQLALIGVGILAGAAVAHAVGWTRNMDWGPPATLPPAGGAQQQPEQRQPVAAASLPGPGPSAALTGAPSPTPTAPAAPTVAQSAPPPGTPSNAPSAVAGRRAEPEVVSPATAGREDDGEELSTDRRRSQPPLPLRDMVWSDRLQRLVPADSIDPSEPPPAPVPSPQHQPTGAPAAGLQTLPPQTPPSPGP
jgi:hypothetical protein